MHVERFCDSDSDETHGLHGLFSFLGGRFDDHRTTDVKETKISYFLSDQIESSDQIPPERWAPLPFRSVGSEGFCGGSSWCRSV